MVGLLSLLLFAWLALAHSHAIRLGPRQEAYLPVVIWHGMGDSCCWERSMGAVKKRIEVLLPGVFVHSIATGEGETGDVLSSYFGTVNEQVEKVCLELRGIPELQGGYVAVGMSQGGQFLRGVVERCQHLGPQMHTLVTMGAQHQGVMNVPNCGEDNAGSLYCRAMQKLLEAGAYNTWVQHHVVQAQYFKDPAALDLYYSCSAYLADINNEGLATSRLQRLQHRANLASLQRLVLFQFDDDDMVVPKESSHFGFFNGSHLLAMEETELYKQDWIGLKELNEGGRLVRDHAPGPHMHFSLDWFGEKVVLKYLAVEANSSAVAARVAAATAR